MTKKYIIPVMEYMVTDVCTLACDYCATYSNYRTKNSMTWDDAKKEIQAWLDRGVEFGRFSLVGGEPTLNPDIDKYIYGIREMMPDTMIQIITNGVVTKHLSKIIQALKSVGNFNLMLSIHLPDNDYHKDFETRILEEFNWQLVDDTKKDPLDLAWYELTDGSMFQVSTPEGFLGTYRNQLHNMKPYHNDPLDAFSICIATTCPLLYQGRLYKCVAAGLLKRVLTDHQLQDDPDWAPYISYQGIGIDCTDKELEAYCNNYNKPAEICTMCPSTKDNPWKPHIVVWKKDIN